MLVSAVMMNSFAQEELDENENFEEYVKHRSIVNIYAGLSTMRLGYMAKTVNYNDMEAEYIPMSGVYGITYDIIIKKWMSVGAAFSYQKLSADHNDYSYQDANDSIRTEDFSTDIVKMNLGARVLFRYLNKKQVNMSSGIRVGANNWSVNTTSADTEYSSFLDKYYGTEYKFVFQVVAMNLLVFFSENVGMSFEMAFGQPHYLSAGLVGRF